MAIAAVISVAVLGGVSVWRVVSLMRADAETLPTAHIEAVTPSSTIDASVQQEMLLLGQATSDQPAAATSSDTIAMIGPMVMAQLVGQYAGLQDRGTYSSASAQAAAEGVASNMRAALSYKTYGVSDIKTDADTSYARMLAYRADLRDALAPLLKNSSPELELFARYIETSDSVYLTQLQAASQNYRDAIALVAAMTVPRDAVNYHRSILNAMAQFAATLDGMASHGNDALASSALLRNFNAAEQDMYVSFDALGAYYGQKKP